MKNFHSTKKKLFLALSLGLSVLCCGVIAGYYSVSYFSQSNSDSGVSLSKTEFGTEIDQIFNTLEIYSQNGENVPLRSYAGEDYIRDMQLLVVLFFVLLLGLYLIFQKVLGKILTPLEADYEDLQNFTQNAGHELKTPLAVVDSGLWVMKEKKEFDIGLITKLQEELSRANQLIESLRDLSSITLCSKTESINVEVFLQEILLKYDEQIQKLGLQIEFDTIENFSIISNRNYADIFFSNLIANAIKYNTEKGSIKIRVISDKVVIEDTGIGIPEAKISKIFHRFYRVREHRGRDGSGLGLSLVKKIADTYNWDIKVISKEKIGTKFIIQFT